MKICLRKLAGVPPRCAVGIVLLMTAIGLASSGCGRTSATTDQDEITRFLNENPDARETKEETSNLKSNEYEGIVRTREKV